MQKMYTKKIHKMYKMYTKKIHLVQKSIKRTECTLK